VSEQAPEQTPEQWLSERTLETRVMARLRKRELVNQAQAGNPAAAAELLSIDRLERLIASRQRIDRVREATKVRAAEG
jgi:hypothetical protein